MIKIIKLRLRNLDNYKARYAVKLNQLTYNSLLKIGIISYLKPYYLKIIGVK